MADTHKKFITHTSIYFIGNLLRRVVSFIMLPIYTRYLTTSDYGVIELFTSVLDFVGIIVGLRIADALFRFYSEYEHVRDKNEVITTGLFLVVLLNLCGILIVSLFSKPISLLLFDSLEFSRLLALYSLTLMSSALIEIPMAFLRARQVPWIFVFFSIQHLLTQLSLNIYFVVFRHMRVEGVVYSAVLSTMLTSIILLIYTFQRTRCRFSIIKAKQLISFSWPLIITSLISFYIVFGDRYFLKFYYGLSEVGIYSLGYKFGFLLGFVIVSPFMNFWQSECYSVVRQKNAEGILHDVMLLFSVAVILFVVILSITVKDLLRVMADPSFWLAYKVVPLILAAYAFDALTNFTKLGILLHKRTHLFIYANLITAAVITVGYIVLIPKMGAIGAGLATLCAYLVRFLWITSVSQKLYKLNIPWKQILLISLLGLFVFGLSQLGPEGLYASIFFNAFLVIVLVVNVFILPILPVVLRNNVISGLRHPKQTVVNYLRSATGSSVK